MTAPTSDERREVAEKLRKNASKRGVTLDYLGSTQVASWWLLLHTIGCESNEQESAFRMLADLIDPTCEVESVEPIEYGEFNQTIGFFFKLTCGHGVTRPQEDMPPAYCDECGARVVSDDDQ